LDTLNFYLHEGADQKIRMVLEFKGRLDADVLGSSLQPMLETFPVLGCRFVADGDGAPRFVPVPGLRLFDVLEVVETEAPATSVRDAMLTRIDPDLGPLLAVVLVRHTDGVSGDTLVLIVDHVATDAQGLKEFAYLLAEVYSARATRSAVTLPAPFYERASLTGLGKTFPVGERARALGTSRPPASNLAGPGVWGAHGHLGVETTSLDPSAFEAARDRARSRGASVNDLLFAAFARAVFATYDAPLGTPVTLMVTGDLRRYAHGDSAPVCNLATVGKVQLEHVADQPFESTLGQAHAALSEWKGGLLGLPIALIADPLYRLAGARVVRAILKSDLRAAKSSGLVAPALTNFGVILGTRLAFAGQHPVSAWMVGPIGYGAWMFVTASTYLSRLTLCLGWSNDDIDAEFPKRLLAQMTAELESVATADPG
jgi:NRPS condensation-like uncharacterized protein